jgi:hypothetical protein
MQATSLRYVFLISALLAGAGLYAAIGEPLGNGVPRWPEADGLFGADSWSVGQQQVERVNTANFVTRIFRSSTGVSATLTLVTNQSPKLYAAGAEVPFLGSGYAVEPAPPGIVAAESGGVDSLVARRGTEQWLVMYAYGERRGLLGNGPTAWTLALLDGIAGRPNDYYKLYLVARADQLDDGFHRQVAELAHTVFPRVAAWYAS